MSSNHQLSLDDVLTLKEEFWPDVYFYEKQIQVIESSFTNAETYVVAANKVGKDFVAAFIVLSGFILATARGWTCRIVTTSVAEHHLKVLWGEIGRYLTTARVPLIATEGGILAVNYQEIRLKDDALSKNPLSYLVGRVSAKGEGLAGHHADFTMMVGDEASGLDDECYRMAQGWARHHLYFGNPNECQNFFRKNYGAGDLAA